MKIILLGYMASGKSTIGKKLSKSLDVSFLDLDDFIIEKEKKSIRDIFKDKGEIYFRNIEHKYLKELLNSNKKFVLSLGGGTPCYANNMSLVLSTDNTTSIYLRGSIKTLTNRLIRKKQKRPLIASLDDDKIEEFIAKHLFERREYYDKASHTIGIDFKSKNKIVREIEELLNQKS